MQKILIHIIILFGCVSILHGQSNFVISPDTTIFQIGEKRNLQLIAPESIIDQNLDYSRWDTLLPQGYPEPFDKENPSIEFLSESEWVNNANGSLEKNIEFIIWRQGIYFLMPLEIQTKDRRSLLSNSISFKVQSPIEANPQLSTEDLAPIKSIIKEPISFLDYIVPILVVLSIIGFFALLAFLNARYSRRKISTEETEYERFTPAEIALQKVSALEEETLWKKEKSKEHQSSFSYILREFLFRNFKFQALELSSNEILQSFKKINEDTAQQNLLHRLLNISDLVKFAKAIPGEEMHKGFLADIRNFISDHDLKEKSLIIKKGDDYAFKKLIYQGLEFDYQLPEEIIHADYKAQLATPYERIFSSLLDKVCIAFLFIAISFIYASVVIGEVNFMNLMIELSSIKTSIILSAFWLILSFLYFPIAQSYFDASFGKWIFRQKFHFVKSKNSFLKYVTRWIVSPFSWFLGIGYIVAFFNDDVQTLHDKAAETVVIKTDEANLSI